MYVAFDEFLDANCVRGSDKHVHIQELESAFAFFLTTKGWPRGHLFVPHRNLFVAHEYVLSMSLARGFQASPVLATSATSTKSTRVASSACPWFASRSDLEAANVFDRVLDVLVEHIPTPGARRADGHGPGGDERGLDGQRPRLGHRRGLALLDEVFAAYGFRKLRRTNVSGARGIRRFDEATVTTRTAATGWPPRPGRPSCTPAPCRPRRSRTCSGSDARASLRSRPFRA